MPLKTTLIPFSLNQSVTCLLDPFMKRLLPTLLFTAVLISSTLFAHAQNAYNVIASVPDKNVPVYLTDTVTLTFDALPASDFKIRLNSSPSPLPSEASTVYNSTDASVCAVDRTNNTLTLYVGNFVKQTILVYSSSLLRHSREYYLTIDFKEVGYTFRTEDLGGVKERRSANMMDEDYNITDGYSLSDYHKTTIEDGYTRHHFDKDNFYQTYGAKGNGVKLAIVDATIIPESDVGNSVVYSTFDIPSSKLSPDLNRGDHYYNHGIQMARYALDYAPRSDIYAFDKFMSGGNAFFYLAHVHDIDIWSQSGSFIRVDNNQVSAMKELIDDGMVVSRSLGNNSAELNTLDDYTHEEIFFPYFYDLTGSKGAFVSLQAVRPSQGDYKTLRAKAGLSNPYTLCVVETGNGATSQATATFSGIVSLLMEINRERNSQFTNQELVECLFQTATDIGATGVDSVFGYGLVNVEDASDMVYNGIHPTFKLYEEISSNHRQTVKNAFDLNHLDTLQNRLFTNVSFDTTEAYKFRYPTDPTTLIKRRQVLLNVDGQYSMYAFLDSIALAVGLSTDKSDYSLGNDVTINWTTTNPDRNIASIDVKVDGTTVATSGNSFKWTSDKKGEITLSITVTDIDGATVKDEMTINIGDAVNQDPTVSISTDKTDYTLGDEVSIIWDANDTDGNIASIDVKIDGKTLTTAGNSTKWKSDKTGTVTISITVTDNEGATATDQVIVDIVEPVNALLTAQNANSEVSLSISGIDPNQVASVGYVIKDDNGIVIDSEEVYGAESLNYVWAINYTGNITVEATVTFNDNSSITSNSVKLAVQRPLGIGDELLTALDLTLFPNPASEHLNIQYTLDRNAEIAIEVFSMDGVKVADLSNGTQSQGDHELNAPISDLNKGVYFIQIKVNDSFAIRKLVVE